MQKRRCRYDVDEKRNTSWKRLSENESTIFLEEISLVPKSGAPGGDRCPPSEDWDVCGTACQLTCENPKPRICTLPCVIGCQCKPGLLRNESGDCVPKESCPADGPESCSPHEEWNDCGTACPLTCENPEPRVCTKECIPYSNFWRYILSRKNVTSPVEGTSSCENSDCLT
ncbi:serine protease inhibitor swm-1-like [Halictus rubicundus]|uniref:serine protease inhibitor swm-1-like n=1 Tax=Halictus rubicundus TaxID=77578 RepID=UPI00403650A7